MSRSGDALPEPSETQRNERRKAGALGGPSGYLKRTGDAHQVSTATRRRGSSRLDWAVAELALLACCFAPSPPCPCPLHTQHTTQHEQSRTDRPDPVPSLSSTPDGVIGKAAFLGQSSSTPPSQGQVGRSDTRNERTRGVPTHSRKCLKKPHNRDDRRRLQSTTPPFPPSKRTAHSQWGPP